MPNMSTFLVLNAIMIVLIPIASPSNIIITTHRDIEQWWVGFTLANQDLSCGGSISNIEISDNNLYAGIWIPFLWTPWNDWRECHFEWTTGGFTAPISVRITKTYQGNDEMITALDVIPNFTPYVQYDFGTNFCRTTASPSSKSPSFHPTKAPTKNPSTPTLNPTLTPTAPPSTRNPTESPAAKPGGKPSSNPSKTPTKNPTLNPAFTTTAHPSQTPTLNPTKSPTSNPSQNPAQNPTLNPTASPTRNPSSNPTLNPTPSPTLNPTLTPTAHPSQKPTLNPTASPTSNLSQNPTRIPSSDPTLNPTPSPTLKPSFNPITRFPTKPMSETPTKNPSYTYTSSATTELDEKEVVPQTSEVMGSTQQNEDDLNKKKKEDTDAFFLYASIILGGVIAFAVVFLICWHKNLISFKPSASVYKIEMNTTSLPGTARNTGQMKERAMSVSYVEDEEESEQMDTGDAIHTEDDDKQSEVENWLKAFRMENYYDVFVTNGMNSLDYIKRMETMDDLHHIGVQLKGHQIILMKEIQLLNKETNDDPVTGNTPGEGDEDAQDADSIAEGAVPTGEN